MPSAYVVGIGVSLADSSVTRSNNALSELSISAGTKALLDTGITYGDINQNIACYLDQDLKVPKSCFATFGKTGSPTCEVDCYSGLFTASQLVKSDHGDCVLMIGLDKEHSQRSRTAVIALVLVSQAFLISHAYLKDSAVLIRSSERVGPMYSRTSRDNEQSMTTKHVIRRALRTASLEPQDIQIVELRHGSDSKVQQVLGELCLSEDGSASAVSHPFVGSTGLAGMCELVWQLRGWTHDRRIPRARNCLQYTMGPDRTASVIILCRADGRAAPEWKQVEYLRDGRERLGYNPAVETRDISFEDWQAVRARDEYVSEQIAKTLTLPIKGGDRAALARL